MVNVKPREKVLPFKGAARRYPFRSSECRDTLVTLARKAKVDLPAADFIGHDIDEYRYDKSPQDDPDWFQEQCMRLMPRLNIVSQKETMIREKIECGIGGRRVARTRIWPSRGGWLSSRFISVRLTALLTC